MATVMLSRYKKLNDNNHTPSEAEISLSAEYTFDDSTYRAGFYLDAMAGADKELEDYTQSLVNPGLFSPVPYLLMMTLLFVIMDKIKDDPEEIRLTGKAEKNLRRSKKKSVSAQTEKTA